MVYICIPTYNEERTIGVVLWKIRQVMAELERDYEVLVVDDASTDGTADVLEPYARIMPVHVRRHDRRDGYGPSLEALLAEAVERSSYPKRDVVVTLQADFTDEPGDIATLVKRIEGGADVVTGRVRMTEGGTSRALRWTRWGWDWVLRRLQGGGDEGDALSGFRAYRVIALRKALEAAGDGPLLTAHGWAANAQLLARVLPHSRRNETVDVRVSYHRLQRESRFEPLRTSMELVRMIRGGDRPRPAPPLPAEAAGGVDPVESGAPADRGREEGQNARGGRNGHPGQSGRGGQGGRGGKGRRRRGGGGRSGTAARESA